jgi:TolA-binding protein
MNTLNRSAIFVALVLIALATIATVSFQADANRFQGLDSGNMASVDVFALIDRDSNAKIDEIQQQLMAIQQEASTLQENDPKLQSMVQQYQQLNSILQGQSQQASQAYQELIAKQIAAAYSEIYSAVNEVADAEGYDFVFATRSTSELLQTDTITGVTQEILARPMLTPRSAVDLTEIVRVKLGYPEETLEELSADAPDTVQEPGEVDSTEPATEAVEVDPSSDE